MPRVSVVLPTWQRGWLVRRAIDSVLAQSWSDLDLVVVDDGSTDDTAEVVGAVDDARVRLLQVPHGGSAAARNAGIGATDSELVAYLDSDNLWHPTFLQVVLDELRPSDVLAYAGQLLLLVGGSRECMHVVARKVRNAPHNPLALLRHNHIDTNTAVHRRSVLDEVGGWDEALPRLVDWDLFGRMAIRHPYGVRHVDQVLCDYRYLMHTVAPTLTNGVMSDATLCSLFGLTAVDPVEQLVRSRLLALAESHGPRAPR